MKTVNVRRTAFAATLILLAAAPNLRAQLQDRVYGLTGTASSGTVSKVTPNEITLGARTIPVNELRRIEFGGEPRELTAARQQALAGQYEDALDSIRKIDRSKVKQSLVAQDILFYEAFAQTRLALRGAGDKKAAATALANFRTKFPESYHYYEASQLFGDVAVASNEYEAAETAYKELQKAPWADFKMKASVLTGRALAAQGKNAEAVAAFDGVISGAASSPQALRQQRFASIGKAAAMAETGSAAEGVQMVEKIIAENDPQDAELMGRAYNALGRCHLKAGKDSDALLAYLHVDLLFFQDPDIHAESLYYLRGLWEKANKLNRAVAAKNLLEERYAGTRWGAK